MNKRTKLLASTACGLLGGYLFATVVGFAKLISLGKTEWSGDVKLLFVPVMHIENHAKSFVVRTEYGVFIIAIATAIAAFAATAYVMQHKKSA